MWLKGGTWDERQIGGGDEVVEMRMVRSGRQVMAIVGR